MRERVARHHGLQRAFGNAYGAHAMVDAAGPEAALGDLEAAPFAEQHVGCRHARIVEADLGMAMRGVIVAEHAERPLHLHSGGSSGTRIMDCCR